MHFERTTLVLYLDLLFDIFPFFSGNIGSELSYNNVAMFISSDAGNTWRQVTLYSQCHSECSSNNVASYFVYNELKNLHFSIMQIFEEEHNVWFLDKGGALVAVKQPTVPTRHLW